MRGLAVAVRVTPSEGAPSLDRELPVPEGWSILVEKAQGSPRTACTGKTAASAVAAAIDSNEHVFRYRSKD